MLAVAVVDQTHVPAVIRMSTVPETAKNKIMILTCAQIYTTLHDNDAQCVISDSLHPDQYAFNGFNHR